MSKQSSLDYEKEESQERNEKGDRKNASKKAVKTREANAKAAKTKKASNLRKAAVVVVLLVILGAIYLWLTYGSIPGALLFVKPMGNASSIESVIFSRLYSNNEVNLSYTGTVTINRTDPYIQIGFMKYYNDTRTTLNLTRFPGIKNVSVVVVAINNGTTGAGCERFWNATTGQNIKGPFTCREDDNGTTKSALALALNRIVEVSTLSNINVNSYGLSFFDGQPCYSASGTGSIMYNETLVGGTGYAWSNFNYTSCLSSQYDVPLTLEGTMNFGDGIFAHVSIQETNMNFNTNLTGVTALPLQG